MSGQGGLVAALLVLASAAGPLARAQPATTAQQQGREDTLTASQAEAVVKELEQLIRNHYVVAEKREPLIRRLRQGRESGRYSVRTRGELAPLITEDLQAASGDGHLGLRHDPAGAERLRSPDGRDVAAARRRDAAASNHGLTEMRLLDGNVRYLRISHFDWAADLTGRAYDDAMRFLSGGDAVILDVRGNGGGEASAVRYAVSHFFTGDSERLLTTFTDDDGAPDQSRVLGYLPAGRITGRPVYVLTDERTNSAAEEFAYHFKQFRLGKLVGVKTRGAANNNRLFPVTHGFVASISYFQPIHAVSRSNWEGSGVIPDLGSEAGRALDAAYVDALETLAGRATGEARIRYDWLLPPARARLRPLQLSASDLRRYEGRFGSRTVRVEGEALMHYAPGLPPLQLVPLTQDLFAFPDTADVRLAFEVENGRAKAVRALISDGRSRTFARSD